MYLMGIALEPRAIPEGSVRGSLDRESLFQGLMFDSRHKRPFIFQRHTIYSGRIYNIETILRLLLEFDAYNIPLQIGPK